MLDIFKTILDVAKSLLGMSDQLRNAERERRKDMSHLFEQISNLMCVVKYGVHRVKQLQDFHNIAE